MEGWWVTVCFSGLSLSLGGLVWILWRDRQRREREENAPPDDTSAKPEGTSVEDLERMFGKKG